MKTILVGTDTSAAADLAVEDAARLARDRDADLVLLYVRPAGDLHAIVDQSKAADPDRHLARLTERYPGVRATARVEIRRGSRQARDRRGGPVSGSRRVRTAP
jgi:nucleotide-binding universal stress UspA family protein